MTIYLDGNSLSIDQLVAISRDKQPIAIAADPNIRYRVDQAKQLVNDIVANDEPVYGINTNFGGLSNQTIDPQQLEYLQDNLIWGLHNGIGNLLPDECIRATMALRINTLLQGTSGIRYKLIERCVYLLNADFLPLVHEHGSIGASGDLVPLAHIAGALLGLSDDFKVKLNGVEHGAITALHKLGLAPEKLEPKEGLALVNGTACLTAIAALAWYDCNQLYDYSLNLHAMIAHAMEARTEAFESFPHQVKPHAGQIAVADKFRRLLDGSRFTTDSRKHGVESTSTRLIQDRYSLRCLPQFLGPTEETLTTIKHQIEVEMNSASDNPILDIETRRVYQAGNFLGQHIALAMDQLRYHVGILAKHLDAQIAMLVTPTFNQGLPASLAAPDARIQYGLNGLQLTLNSIMPRLQHLGQGIVQFFPTHAETFNQNINSQGFASANLARDTAQTFRDYLATATLFCIQAVELKTYQQKHTYDAPSYLPYALQPLYKTVYQILGLEPQSTRPLIVNNTEQSNSAYINKLSQALPINLNTF